MGGIERASCTLANEFSRQGIKVFYFCMFNHIKFFKLIDGIYLDEPDPRKSQRFNLISAPLRIRRLAKKIKPDSVLVFNKFLGALTLLSLAGLKFQIYISERASPHYTFASHIEIFNKVVYKIFKPDGIIAQTNYAYTVQHNFYRKGTRFKVIHNALRDIDVFDVPRKKQVLAVGRFNDYLKGFDRLVKCFSLLKNRDWTLVFAGGDAQSGKQLYELAEKLNIQHRIQFRGKVKNIDNLYAESGIFVLPSRTEGFPNALVEAMAAGLPCIAFKYNPGISEIIEDGFNGILVEEGNIPALAEKLDYLMENEAERVRLGSNARLIRDKLACEVISTQYIEFILPNYNKS